MDIQTDKEPISAWDKLKPNKMFEDFWKIYPRKIAKLAARKAWDKIPSKEHGKIFFALHLLNNNTWKIADTKFIPHPATWLNGYRWEDEVIERLEFVEQKNKPSYYESFKAKDEQGEKVPGWLKQQFNNLFK